MTQQGEATDGGLRPVSLGGCEVTLQGNVGLLQEFRGMMREEESVPIASPDYLPHPHNPNSPKCNSVRRRRKGLGWKEEEEE